MPGTRLVPPGDPLTMSEFVVEPCTGIAGRVRVPGDKSISHRALMLGAIATGTTQVEGFLEGEDCLATLRAVASLGVNVQRPGPGEVVIEGVGLRGLGLPRSVLDMGNAGTAMRLFMGLLSAQGFDSELVGDESLMRRPMERVAKPLRAMGAQIETRDGRPPVRIRGGAALRGLRYEMPVASAQVKSAVLLAGLYAEGETTVVEPAVTRDHTERMLQSFGANVVARGGSATVLPAAQLEAARISVPGDFSSAACFIVAACIGAREPFVIEGVGVNPTRTGLLEMLALMGADLRLINHRNAGAEPVADIEVRPARLRGIRVPERLVPLAIDEFPGVLHRRGLRRRRNAGHGGRGVARQGERPDRGHGAWARCTGDPQRGAGGRAPDRGRFVRRRRRRQPRRSPGGDVVCRGEPARLGTDRDPGRRQRRDFVSGLRGDGACGRAAPHRAGMNRG